MRLLSPMPTPFDGIFSYYTFVAAIILSLLFGRAVILTSISGGYFHLYGLMMGTTPNDIIWCRSSIIVTSINVFYCHYNCLSPVSFGYWNVLKLDDFVHLFGYVDPWRTELEIASSNYPLLPMILFEVCTERLCITSHSLIGVCNIMCNHSLLKIPETYH